MDRRETPDAAPRRFWHNGRAMELGLGLIGIGRPWGVPRGSVPAWEQVEELLEAALEAGILFWDTASSYGSSEERIGRFLRGRPGAAARVRIATKFGDVWEPGMEESYGDHSFGSLMRSLDRSMALLPRIDVLQVHRATEEALRLRDVSRALGEAERRGVREFGASVKTVEAARIAIESGRFGWLQIPFNPLRREMEPVFELARAHGLRLLVNRPFAEGRLLHDEEGRPLEGDAARRRAFAFLRRYAFEGFVLAGTRSPAHLRDNARLWRETAAGAA
ncbi:MAG: aldo/keto reductase [Bryobacteraceae bacterium]|nr:aldo/keto reductase [Bryobacteraceae bacterium]